MAHLFGLSGGHFVKVQLSSRKNQKYLQMAFGQMRILASISAGKVQSRAQAQNGLVHICTKTFVPGIFFCKTMATPCKTSDSTIKNKKGGGWRVSKALVGGMATQRTHFYGEMGCCWPADNCGSMPVQVPCSQARTLEGFLNNRESLLSDRPGDLHSTSLS